MEGWHVLMMSICTCEIFLRKLPDEGQSLMQSAMTQLNLSAQVYHRILKLARTMSDLPGWEEIQSVHLGEALQYRPKLMLS